MPILRFKNYDDTKELKINISVSDFYGTGEDGILNTTSDILLPSIIDGEIIYKNYESLTINEGHILTTQNRCKGLVIYVQGDCIINGILSMTGKGAIGLGQDFSPRFFDQVFTSIGPFNLGIGAVGGVGGGNVSASSANITEGIDGLSGINGAGGGGGSGRAVSISGTQIAKSGAGTAGTSWSGGSGGGGAVSVNANINATNAIINGGRGGNANSNNASYSAGGGAGNPGGIGIRGGSNGGNGTGGLLILCVGGRLIVNGSIQSNGLPGGTGLAGGGSSGGGSLTVLYQQELVLSGTIQANGGPRVNGGGAGGAGSLRIYRCHHVLTPDIIDNLIVDQPNINLNNTEIQFPIELTSTFFNMSKYEGYYPDYHEKSIWQVYDTDDNSIVYNSESYDLLKHTIINTWDNIKLDHPYRFHVKHKTKFYDLYSPLSDGYILSTPILPIPEITNMQFGSDPELIPITFTGSDNLDLYNPIYSEWKIIKKSTQQEVFISDISNIKTFILTEDILNNDWLENIQENTEYEVQMRYYCSMYNQWSQWSPKVEFITPHISMIQPEFLYPNNNIIDIHDFPRTFDGSDNLTYYENNEWELKNITTDQIYYYGTNDNKNSGIIDFPLFDYPYVFLYSDYQTRFRYRSRIYKVYTKWANFNFSFDELSDFNSTGNTNFASTVDGSTVYRYYKNFTINNGHTVTTSNRCRGLVLYVDGDCTINGTLSMTARGCRGVGQSFAPFKIDQIQTTSGIQNYTIGATGGAGGARRYLRLRGEINGLNGSSGQNGTCGGGGSGRIKMWNSGVHGQVPYAYSGSGSAGTTWSGGSGGGGVAKHHEDGGTHYGGNGGSNGGAGGTGNAKLQNWHHCHSAAGGGAGNPGGAGFRGIGTPSSSINGKTGTGGLIVLFVKNNIINNNIIMSNGSLGGEAKVANDSCCCDGGGGSSGGGGITILRNGSYINNGTISTAGGSRVFGGGAGGAGSLRNIRFFPQISNPEDIIITKPETLSNNPMNFPLTLSSSEFEINKIDNLIPDAHHRSHWQIHNITTDTTVYDSGEVSSLTNLVINNPWGGFNQNHEYKWRVRYKSQIHGIWSDWSNYSNETSANRPNNIGPMGVIYNFPIELESDSILDGHSKSRWVIRNTTNNTIIYDSGEIEDLTSHIINYIEDGINLNHNYYWNVQHYSEANGWTQFSNLTKLDFFNFSINQPENISPMNEISLQNTVLEFSEFNSTNEYINGDLIEIKIRKKHNGIIIYNEQIDYTNSLNIDDVIDRNLEYEWQVRYRVQGHRLWSDWSNWTSFINYYFPFEEIDLSRGELHNLFFDENILSLIDTNESGYRILPVINLEPLQQITNVRLEWGNNDVSAQISISNDSGQTWGNWINILNDTNISQLDNILDPIGYRIKFRYNFNHLYNPVLYKSIIKINMPYVPDGFINLGYVESGQ